MSDTIETQRGQSIALAITFFEEDEGGDPLDLTGATLTVREASPAILLDATVAITDDDAGECSLALSEAQADQLGSGRVNWFRLEAQFDAENVVTPKIWINVR